MDSEKKLFVNEFKRDSAISLDLAGKPQAVIVRAVQNLNVNKCFVSRTIARYWGTGNISSRPNRGRNKKKKTVTTPEMIRKLNGRFE